MFAFKIPVGDWSGDGHGKCTYYDALAECSKIEEVREAYFTAKANYPDLCPERYCGDYGDHKIPAHIVDAAIADGLDWSPGEMEWASSRDFVQLVVWFLNKGNPELKVRLAPDVPLLAFFGLDKQERHIGFMGYGLFSC